MSGDLETNLTGTTVRIHTKDLQKALLEQDTPSFLFEHIVRASDESVDHKEVLTIWESLIRVMAMGVWSVVRARGWDSPDLATQSAGLRKPAMGIWAGVLRAGVALIGNHPKEQCGGMQALAKTLRATIPTDAMAVLFDKFLDIEGLELPGRTDRTTFDLIQAIVTYRNWSEHGGGQGCIDDQRQMAPLLAKALREFAVQTPLTGDGRLLLVTGRRAQDERYVLHTLPLHGACPTREELDVDVDVFQSVRDRDIYLLTPTGQLLPMKPMLIARAAGGQWNVGWLLKLNGDQVTASTGRRDGAASFVGSVKQPDIDRLFGPASQQSGGSKTDTTTGCPWPGLPAYGEADSSRFHGRRNDIRRALELVANHNCVVIHGISGAGKSSLLRAGILPGIRTSTVSAAKDPLGPATRPLRIVEFVPGIDALAQLRQVLVDALSPEGAGATLEWQERVTRALADLTSGDRTPAHDRYALATLLAFVARDSDLVLIVDQFEQLWQERTSSGSNSARLLDADSLRLRIVELLSGAAERAKESNYHVLMTIRVDMLDRPMQDTGFCRLQERCGLALGPMDAAGIEEVIRTPLAGRGIIPTKEFVDAVVTDALASRGGLSLLATLLHLLWFRGRQFTLDAYHGAGRLAGVINRRAEEARAEMLDAASPTAHRVGDGGSPRGAPLSNALRDREDALARLFRQCVSVTADERYIRRWVALSSLSASLSLSETDIRAYLEPFIQRRLVLLAPQGQETRASAPIGVQVAHDSLFTEWGWLREQLDKKIASLRLRDTVEEAAKGFRDRRGQGVWHDDDPRLAQAIAEREHGDLELSREARDFLRVSERRARLERRLRWAAVGVLVLLLIGTSIGAWRARAAQRLEEFARVYEQDTAEFMVHAFQARLSPIGGSDGTNVSERFLRPFHSFARSSGLDWTTDSHELRGAPERHARRLTVLRLLLNNLQPLNSQVSQESSEPQVLRDLAFLHRLSGDVLRQEGQPVPALDEYVRALRLLNRLPPLLRNEATSRTDMVIMQHHIGRSFQDLGNARGALESFRDALNGLRTMRSAGQLTPPQTAWIEELERLKESASRSITPPSGVR